MSFNRILGQERALQMLKQSLKRDKVHHAYLFSGLDGIGKKKAAFELAKALNCLEPGPEGSCDRCPSCRKIESQNHPDVVTLKPEGQFIRIEQIRSLSQQLAYKPYFDRYRVCILDKASDLHETAANAFLKILEEPPEGNLFLLLASDPWELLPTLLSRCLPIPFNPLSVSVISQRLMEEKGLSAEEALSLSLVSAGSLGRAYQYLKSGFWKRQEDWIALLEGLSGSKRAWLMDKAKVWAGSKEDIPEILEVGQWCLRDLLWIRAGLEEQVYLRPDLKDRVRTLAFGQPERTWLNRYALLNEAARTFSQNVAPLLAWEALLFKMARPSG